MKKLIILSVISVCIIYTSIVETSEPVRQHVPSSNSIEKGIVLDYHKDPRVRAFLDILAYGEGTSYHPEVQGETDQYRLTYCNTGKITSFNDHPRKKCCYPSGNRILCGTSAGRYMFLERTWDWVQKEMNLNDFCPLNQDLAAIFLLIEAKALDEILRNNIQDAIKRASRFWAPMPGNSYNQPQKKLDELINLYYKRLTFYQKHGGTPYNAAGRL